MDTSGAPNLIKANILQYFTLQTVLIHLYVDEFSNIWALNYRQMKSLCGLGIIKRPCMHNIHNILCLEIKSGEE